VIEVVAAAERRAAALAARDAGALRALLHPAFRWTTHTGAVLDRDAYVAANTGGDLVWRSQRLEDVEVAGEGDAAVLVAVVVDDVEREGTSQRFRMRVTQTWVRSGAEWRCLSGHAGPLL
jgi:ketosteroid isomerase-like protein